MRVTSKQLGDDGERHTCELLREHGYVADLLAVNAKTYDVRASRAGAEFLISVKVSRDKQHVRLGSRRSVLDLEAGHFVFAYLPPQGLEIASLSSRQYALLILPADLVRTDSLSIHDAYWIDKSKDPNIFSVMVKGYGRHHREMWPRWLEYRDAWSLLP